MLDASSCAALVFSGYWRDPAATEAAFTEDAFVRTATSAASNPATGHLVIQGRIAELVRRRQPERLW